MLTLAATVLRPMGNNVLFCLSLGSFKHKDQKGKCYI